MASAAFPSRRLLACLVLAGALALLAAGRAQAGYAVWPNGQSFEVTAAEDGSITSPQTLDLVVYLDQRDSDAYVWVSDTPQVGPFGTPAGRTVGSCSPGSLIPFGEPGKWVCRVPTILMAPGHTYYWWLDFRRSEPGQALPRDHVSGPYGFSLAQAAAPPPADEGPPPPPADDPGPPVSHRTVAAAATLPGAAAFTGARSIKHTVLTRLVYRTMEELGAPRQLAFACWSEPDWLSVVQAEGDEPDNGDTTLLGFWLVRQPRWLHLAPRICTDVQGLLSTKQPNARRAGALTTVIHEALHAYGVSNEAKTNCLAVQLSTLFGASLGMRAPSARYLGTLALHYTRRYAPPGYWNRSLCRDGGAWDLFARSKTLS